MQRNPDISIVLATFNRRAVVLSTLARLTRLPCRYAFDVQVVDNASTDGTADAIETAHPDVRVIRLAENYGSCAKAFGVDQSNAELVIFVDDDSCPHEGSIERMVAHFRDNPKLASAGFAVHLTDGRQESAALPHVFVGCGVGLRRSALMQVGGLDRGLFMQAEEYDLCFRLIGAGWDVEVFDDIHVDHLKSPQARLSDRTCYYDTRNNLIVTARHIPDEYESVCREDTVQRYRWIAEAQGHALANADGERAGLERYPLERDAFADRRLSVDQFETLFRYAEVEARMRELYAGGIEKIMLADLGKNIYSFVRGAAAAGIEIAAIVDDRFAKPGRAYRNIRIVERRGSDLKSVEAVVVANMSPAHAARTRQWWQDRTDLPIHAWYESTEMLQPNACGEFHRATAL